MHLDLFIYVYEAGQIKIGQNSLFYISNWDFNKKVGLGVMYSMIIISLFLSCFSHNNSPYSLWFICSSI